jgi:hypothetical protein
MLDSIGAYYTQNIESLGELRIDTPEMAPFSRVVKSQNSSKSHLFQELENTLISR